MGLDQYLSAKLHLSEYSDKETCNKVRGIFPDIGISDNLNTMDLSFEIGYWRKANQIHKWFVDNVQDGEDDCGDYYVEREQLQELLDICKKVKEKAIITTGQVLESTSWSEGKETKNYTEGRVIQNQEEIAQLLPSESGFFFGGTEYNEWYLMKIENTIEILEKALKLDKKYSFSYSSSW